eukprot:RCo022523
MSEKKPAAPKDKGGKRGGKKTKEDEIAKEVPKEPEFPDGPKTWVVGGWSELATLPQALAVADGTVGDKIALQPGTYVEDITLTKENIHIRGVGEKSGVVIAGAVVSQCSEGSLLGVTLQGSVTVEKGSILLSECAVKSGKHGVRICSYASPTIKSCECTEQEVSGIYCFPNSRGVVEGCTLTGTGAEGTVGIFADDSGTIFRKNVVRKQVTGAMVNGACSGLLLDKNEFGDISGSGVHVASKAAPTLKGNTIHSCHYYGLLVEKEAKPTLSGNTVTACAVAFRKGAAPVLRGNTFTGRVLDENVAVNPRLAPDYSS